MIPYSYNMVDMGGIDLAEANGTVVEGLYAKIVEAVNACGDVVLYNWKFAGIEISPQHTSILLGDPIIINGAVQVTEQDEVTVPGINPEPPPPPVIVPLSANQNGEYLASDYEADGFDPVNVVVPPPVLTSLQATENTSYYPEQGVDGFNEVIVSVPGTIPPVQFHSGKLAINTGVITEDAQYCYSDLIPITAGTGRWLLDLARTDLESFYIGLTFYAEDGVTQVGYIRQYERYRYYSANISGNPKYFRIANKVANLSFASVVSLIDDIYVLGTDTNVFVNKEE